MCSSYSSEPNIVVDLRPAFVDVRDQGPRPLCLVFATSDLNSHVNNLVEPLSIEFLAYHAYDKSGIENFHRGLSVFSVYKALEGGGQPPEYMLPYNPAASRPPQPQPVYKEMFSSTGIEAPLSTQEITRILDAGEAVVICFRMPSDFFNPAHPFVIDGGADDLGGHAVIAVGYGTCQSGEVCLLIRNSWGGAWCDGGYAWVTNGFLSTRMITTLRLTV